MKDSPPRVGEQRPGGRAERVRTAVLEATSELLMRDGYDQLSIDDVAAKAGVHKTTVYRRWPSKPRLVADAVQVHAESNIPMPDTGSILGDLQALASDVAANLSTGGGSRWSRSIVAAAATSDELAKAMHGFWTQRLAATELLVTRAIERGELPADCDPNLIIETLVGPIWLRLLLTGEPIDNDFAQRIAELVAAGALQQRPAE